VLALGCTAIRYYTNSPPYRKKRPYDGVVHPVYPSVVQFRPISPKWKLVEVPNFEEMVPFSHVTENFILVHGHVEFWNR